MGIRRNLGGRYVEARERSTSKGKKGTIMKNWSSKTKKKEVSKINPLIIIVIGTIVVLLISIILLILLFL
ncbi:MAG: hypothetical protein LAT82_05575 [Nanoarchaeota archaeon]|nr:hypothetical protein [Nanoarchaeota archaeon]